MLGYYLPEGGPAGWLGTSRHFGPFWVFKEIVDILKSQLSHRPARIHRNLWAQDLGGVVLNRVGFLGTHVCGSDFSHSMPSWKAWFASGGLLIPHILLKLQTTGPPSASQYLVVAQSRPRVSWGTPFQPQSRCWAKPGHYWAWKGPHPEFQAVSSALFWVSFLVVPCEINERWVGRHQWAYGLHDASGFRWLTGFLLSVPIRCGHVMAKIYSE